jgi:hypothetical protein
MEVINQIRTLTRSPSARCGAELSEQTFRSGAPMRDWMIILTPIAIMLWALLYPERSQEIADWVAGSVLNW